MADATGKCATVQIEIKIFPASFQNKNAISLFLFNLSKIIFQNAYSM